MRDPQVRIETLLANLPLFMEAAPEEIERIAQGTRQLHVPRGEILFNKGDPCESFHLLVYGQVKLALTSPRVLKRSSTSSVPAAPSARR